MVTFLFWNIGRNDIPAEVASATRENNVDILILAESRLNNNELLRRLNQSITSVYRELLIDLSPKLKFYTRYAQHSLDSLLDDGGIALRLIKPPIGREVLLAAVHLPSKMHRRDSEQIIIATKLGKIIREKETELGHRNTIIIGDLNMDPFEPGIIAARGVHAISDKAIARRIYRQVDGENISFFYNPMWNYLGDENANPPGTYY